MKLVFHNPLTEADWFTFLLSDVVDEVVYDTTYAGTHGRAIHVVSGNVVPLRGRSAYFEKCRAESDDLTLLHASDEWCAGGYTSTATSTASSATIARGSCAPRGSSRFRSAIHAASPARIGSRPRTSAATSGHSKARSRRLASRWSKR